MGKLCGQHVFTGFEWFYKMNNMVFACGGGGGNRNAGFSQTLRKILQTIFVFVQDM